MMHNESPIMLLGCAGLAVVAAAATAAPVIIEIQLPSSTVTRLLWDRLYTDEICLLDPFPFPFEGDPNAVLDRVRFPEQPEVVNLDSVANVIVVADVFLRAEECVTRSCGPGEYFSWDGRLADPLTLELTYSLDLTVDAETDPDEPTATLCLSLASVFDVDTGLDIPSALLPDGLRTALENFECPSFSLASLKKNLLGDDSTITRSGMSASANGSRLAMRFEIDGPGSGSASSWDQFHAGTLAPTDASLGWSLFIDSRLLESKVNRQIDDELKCKENPRLEECHRDFDDDGVDCDEDTDDPRCDELQPFRRTAGPTADYSAGGASGGGHIHIELKGEIPGDFTETPCPNTIHIDPVEIDVDLRIESADPGWMKSRIVIDPDPDDDDILECAFVLGSLPGPISSVLTLIILPIVADCFDPDPSQVGLDETCEDINAPTCMRYCNQLDDDEYDCADRLNFGDPLDVGGPTIGILHLTGMIGLDAGAVLGGALQHAVRPPLFGATPLPPIPHVPRRTLSVDNGFIREGLSGGCSSLRWGYLGGFDVEGDGVLCQPIAVFNDPPERHDNEIGVYDVLWPGEDPRGADYIGQQTVKIRFPTTSNQTVLDHFFAYPYDFQALVRTSAGLQYYVIAAPPPPDNAARLAALTEAFNQCNAGYFGLRLANRALLMLWAPDPPPLEMQLYVTYVDDPPVGEIHRAFLTELSVESLNITSAFQPPRGPAMLFSPELQLTGKVHLDLGTFGQKVIPFSQTMESMLMVTDLHTSLQTELAPWLGLSFMVEALEGELPPGVSTAQTFITLSSETVRFQTMLFQVAGPADFDESGDVGPLDWQVMAAALSEPKGPVRVSADFDDDGDTDLADLQAFQNWYTGAR